MFTSQGYVGSGTRWITIVEDIGNALIVFKVQLYYVLDLLFSIPQDFEVLIYTLTKLNNPQKLFNL